MKIQPFVLSVARSAERKSKDDISRTASQAAVGAGCEPAGIAYTKTEGHEHANDHATRSTAPEHTGEAEPRRLLSDFIRDDLGLTGTHVGCEHGVCGACTVLVNGDPVRSCLMFAVQAEGAEIDTVEGLAPDADTLHPLQEQFQERHGLQCGFCTPGILLTARGAVAGESRSRRDRDPRVDQRQPVPLHGLPQHRHGHSRGPRGKCREDSMCGISYRRQAAMTWMGGFKLVPSPS